MKPAFLTFSFAALTAFRLFAGELMHVEIKARSGDAVYLLFEKYELNPSTCALSYFKEINHLSEDLRLISEEVYK
ncbi:MAG: hypothetical protein FJY07_13140, partial [Bacteroidetes bacterium]|nr:hypothetical protein [Bacteroidota bacterium]